MKPESHARARQLMIEDRIEGIRATERGWLDQHLASCPECSSRAIALDAAVLSLRTLPIAANSDVVEQARLTVRARAQQLQAARERAVPLWIATAFSSVWMIAVIPFVLLIFAWLGRFAHAPGTLSLVAFLVWWFLPATVLGAAAAWRHVTKHDVSSWVTQNNWGQQ